MPAPIGNDYSPGRFSEYDPHYHDEEAKNLALLGYSLKEMAEAMGLGLTTLKRWMKERGSFRASVYEGRSSADAKVAAAFYKRATGYEYPAVKHFVVNIGDFKQKVEEVQVTAVVLPDAGAALNWLKNRQPDKWRDKQDINLTGEIELTMNLDGDSATPETQN